MKHKFLLLLAICSLSAVNAKELFVMQSAKEMTPTRNIKVNEKGFVIGKTSVIYSSRLFAFDPAKAWKGTAKFRIVMLLESSESGAEVEFSQLKLEEL
ncbi:MAG: hypothetical protein E7051_09620 [Lentisphaerae bacterium]|nr:hypothetical protein [Lentisphaerota bacterium]